MTKISSFFTVAVVGVVWLVLCSQTHADLINHWKCDEASTATAVVDSAGSTNALDATLQGDAAFVNDATRGQVLSFDGTDDYASNSGEPFLNDTTHTAGVWINAANTSGLQGWISWGIGGSRYFFGLNESSILAASGQWSNNRITTESTATANTWQYWTLVRDLENTNTSIAVYRNGQLVYQKTDAAYNGTISASGELTLGKYYSGECFNGMMSDMAIWNEALTADEINNAMNYGAENYQIPEPSSAALLLIATLGGLAVLRLRPSRKR